MRRAPLNGVLGIQKVKAAVRDRDGLRCVRCGVTDEEHRERFGRGLEVHRKTPGGVYTVDGCETLCRMCHGPEPKSPAGSRIGVNVPGHLLAPLRQYAEEHSTEDEKKSISWAAKRLLRIGLSAEGKGGDPRKEK